MFRLCQKSWSLRARISKDGFCSATLEDGRQLLLTHVPYLLNESYVLNALNADLTRFWLTCMFGPLQLVSENRLCEPISIKSEVRRERILKAHIKKRQLRRVQWTVRVRRACIPHPLNPSITIYTSVHLNFWNCMHMHAIIILLPAVRWCLTIHPYHCSI